MPVWAGPLPLFITRVVRFQQTFPCSFSVNLTAGRPAQAKAAMLANRHTTFRCRHFVMLTLAEVTALLTLDGLYQNRIKTDD